MTWPWHNSPCRCSYYVHANTWAHCFIKKAPCNVCCKQTGLELREKLVIIAHKLYQFASTIYLIMLLFVAALPVFPWQLDAWTELSSSVNCKRKTNDLQGETASKAKLEWRLVVKLEKGMNHGHTVMCVCVCVLCCTESSTNISTSQNK